MNQLSLLFLVLSQTVPEQPLKMIERYGIMAVAVVFLAITCIYLLKFILNKHKKQDDKITELQNMLIDMAKHNETVPLDGKAIMKKAESSQKINNLLFNMLAEYNADRISIYEFHNGGKTTYGFNFNKATCTYEAARDMAENRTRDFQNVPISTNVLWNTLILTKSSLYIHNAEDLKNTEHGLYFMLKVNNIKSYYANLLMDFSNNPIGLISMEFINRTEQLTDTSLNSFNTKTFTITGLLLKE